MKKSELKTVVQEILDSEMKAFVKECFRNEAEKAFKSLGLQVREDYRKFLRRFEREWKEFDNKTTLGLKKQSLASSKGLKSIRVALKAFTEKNEIVEETLLSIYSNIKRNQFLYAYYPEEWNETFLEFKEKIKKENEEFKELMQG